MSEPFVSNVISHKYDTALDFHVTMYDNLPYQRDSDYCNIEKLAIVSGRVIKFYLYINQPEIFLVDNQDDNIDEILAKAAEAQNNYLMEKRAASAAHSGDVDVTPEQIQTLLDDRDTDTVDYEEDDDELAAAADAVNAFADVEDW